MSFYQKLYTADPTVCFTLVNQSNVYVKEHDVSMLAREVSLSECTAAVSKLKTSKTPGCDGLSPEFYQFFGPQLKSAYVQVLEESIKTGKLNASACRGVISLIPKKNKDLLSIRNWRPLTMLNTDYKILATLLASRIKKILEYIIADDQTGFMAGRQISSTIRKVDLVHIGNYYQFPGYIVNADFEKCFDLISYDGIRGSLHYFGFPDNYIQLVNLLLEGFESCVTNNGFFSEYFIVGRSCHQGCPLAPYLMVLCGEVMAIQFRQNSSIPPYIVQTLSQKIAQYADDSIV